MRGSHIKLGEGERKVRLGQDSLPNKVETSGDYIRCFTLTLKFIHTSSPSLIFTGTTVASLRLCKTPKSLPTKLLLGLFMPLLHKLVCLLLIVIYFMLECCCFTQVDSDLPQE